MNTRIILRALSRTIKALLPRTKWGDNCFGILDFIAFHKRLPRFKSGGFNDAMFYIKTSQEVRDPLRVFVSDKELAKYYVAAKVGNEFNVPTLAVFNSLSQALAATYPPDCVIKPTHMSGQVIFRRGGSSVDESKLTFWFKSNYYSSWREENYRTLRPKVIVEPFIFDNETCDDYKIFCVNGNPKLIQVDTDRFSEHKRDYYLTDWEKLPFSITYPIGIGVPRPANLEKMLNVASKLSANFNIIRVDLYTNGKSILVGELTNCHDAGRSNFLPPEADFSAAKILFGDLGFNQSQLQQYTSGDTCRKLADNYCSPTQ
jgi:hypothetical protein